MKYIIMLYITALMFFLIGLGFGISEFLGIGEFAWALMAGIALAVCYLLLFLRSINKVRKEMNGVVIHNFQAEVISSTFIFALTLTMGISGIGMFITEVVDSFEVFIPLGLGIIAVLYLFYHIRGLSYNYGLSAFYFNDDGIEVLFFGGTNIRLRWDECVDIGIGTYRGRVASSHFYFSKDSLTVQQVRKLQTVKRNERFVRMEFNKEILEDLLKYIDKNRIKNLQRVHPS